MKGHQLSDAKYVGLGRHNFLKGGMNTGTKEVSMYYLQHSGNNGDLQYQLTKALNGGYIFLFLFFPEAL